MVRTTRLLITANAWKGLEGCLIGHRQAEIETQRNFRVFIRQWWLFVCHLWR